MMAPLPKDIASMDIGAIREYLAKIDDVHIPIPRAQHAIAVEWVANHTFGADGWLACMMGYLLHHSPIEFNSEMTTSVAVSQFIPRTLQALSELSGNRPAFTFSLDVAEAVATVPSITKQGTRPDMLVTIKGYTLMIGEDKLRDRIRDAVNAIRSKVTSNRNEQLYGSLRYTLAYAAAGMQLQFLVVDHAGKVRLLRCMPEYLRHWNRVLRAEVLAAAPTCLL
jgi:hypothetical protein